MAGNILEDTINFGFGVFAYSREKIEELVETLVQKGEVAKKDASSFVSELVKKGEAERSELQRIVGEEVKKAMNTVDQMKPVTKDEVREIIREEMKKQSEEK
jgi:polyhydroxyalkanoate synthesis regulator phasin